MRKFLNEVFNGYIQFIDIYNMHKEPKKPFATYQVLSTDPNGVDTIIREKSQDNENMISETIIKMFQDSIQIDVYTNSIAESKAIAQKIISDIQFRYREILTDRGLGLVNITSIVPITSKGVSEVEFRANFNIIFSYCLKYTNDIENVDSVIYREKEWSE